MRVRLLAGFTALVVVGLLTAIPAHAIAINQIINGTFDSNTNGWYATYPSQVTPVWVSSPDHTGTVSGSVLLRDLASSQPSGTYYGGLGQCTTSTAGDSYHLAASTLIYSGQSYTGSVAVFVLFYTGANCTGSTIGNGAAISNTHADGNWYSKTLDGTAPAGTQSAQVVLSIYKGQAGGEFDGYFDDILFYSQGSGGSGTCTPDATHLCLTGNRFRVSVQWTNYNTNVTAAATAVPFVDESGFFYFQDPSNIEIMVKVHDACAGFGHFWFFSAATTNVGYTITVTDTKTAQTETYSNPAHVLSAANTDQSSFASCP